MDEVVTPPLPPRNVDSDNDDNNDDDNNNDNNDNNDDNDNNVYSDNNNRYSMPTVDLEGGPPPPKRTLKAVKHSSVKACNPKVFIIFVIAVLCVCVGVILSLVGGTTIIYFGIVFYGVGGLLIVFSTVLARCWSQQVGEETM